MGIDAKGDTPIIALTAEYNFMRADSIEKKIAQIVLAHISQISEMTLEQASTMCNVSTSTFLRFCKRIGYPSFSAFKMKITEAVANYGYKNRPFSETTAYNSENYFSKVTESINNAIHDLQTSLDLRVCRRFIDELYHKDKIYIHTAMYSTIRLALQSDLALTGKTVTFSPNNQQQREDAAMADKDSLYILSYDGNQRSREILNTIPAVKRKSAKIAVITPLEQFSGSQFCDYIFRVGKGSGSISELMIHDLIYQYFSVLYREKYIHFTSV